jgi:cysteine desulfurase family protein (TIGR01976 family)
MLECISSMKSVVHELRSQFPSLVRRSPDGTQSAIYLDGPAGSQVPQVVIDAISNYYLNHNANSGGKFPSSIETTQMLTEAHQVAADWFGANDWRECIFGANMTTLTLAFSRALSKTWRAGERIVVTELDHDGNVTPWKLAAADARVEVATVRINPDDATLDLDDFRRQVTPGTRLVALTCASNSVGSKPPIQGLIEVAHAVGAEVYLDAVHYAPHGLIDVQAWNADYCVCSAYKFFGPHVGLLWGRLERLEALNAYKLRPAPAHPPGKWMTGTQNFAAIAGVVAAIDYIAHIGRRLSPPGDTALSRRECLRHAFAAIESYERELRQQRSRACPHECFGEGQFFNFGVARQAGVGFAVGDIGTKPSFKQLHRVVGHRRNVKDFQRFFFSRAAASKRLGLFEQFDGLLHGDIDGRDVSR